MDHLGEPRHGTVLIGHQGHEARGELRQVPGNDPGLVLERVPTLPVDRGIDRGGVVAVHEGAGAVVDRLARDRGVVGVHHAVDEAHRHPLRDQTRLPRDDRLEQRLGAIGLGRVTGDDVIGQRLQRVPVLPGKEILEGADADMARRHAGQDRPGQGRLAPDVLARRHGGQRAGGRNAKRVHRLAHHVFAQDRPQPGPAIAHAGIGRGACALQLDVPADAAAIDHLAQQDRSAVAQLGREAAELVSGIGLRQRHGALGRAVAREDLSQVVASGQIGQAKRVGQRGVERQKARRGDRRRVEPGEEAVRQAGVGIVEGDGEGHGTEIGPGRSDCQRWQGNCCVRRGRARQGRGLDP